MRKSPLETVYEDAFKKATGDGEKRRGAHIAGLRAVCDYGRQMAEVRPFKWRVAQALRKLGNKLDC